MNIIENIQQNSPISGVPDLLQLHNSNPLNLSWIAQILIIFVIVEIMAFVNYQIRYKGKSNLYPTLYTLFGLSIIGIYYYCFQIGFPEIYIPELKLTRPVIVWFCYPQIVGWVWAIIGILCIAHVTYTILASLMQIVAQLSVDGKISGDKPWKEWKLVMGIALVGVVLTRLIYFADATASSWALVVAQILIIISVLIKMVRDCMRCSNPLWGILIGLVFYIGIVAVTILATQCLQGALVLSVAFIAWFSSAKARKKNPKKKSDL